MLLKDHIIPPRKRYMTKMLSNEETPYFDQTITDWSVMNWQVNMEMDLVMVHRVMKRIFIKLLCNKCRELLLNTSKCKSINKYCEEQNDFLNKRGGKTKVFMNN